MHKPAMLARSAVSSGPGGRCGPLGVLPAVLPRITGRITAYYRPYYRVLPRITAYYRVLPHIASHIHHPPHDQNLRRHAALKHSTVAVAPWLDSFNRLASACLLLAAGLQVLAACCLQVLACCLLPAACCWLRELLVQSGFAEPLQILLLAIGLATGLATAQTRWRKHSLGCCLMPAACCWREGCTHATALLLLAACCSLLA